MTNPEKVFWLLCPTQLYRAAAVDEVCFFILMTWSALRYYVASNIELIGGSSSKIFLHSTA
jgi:hypothetical protein